MVVAVVVVLVINNNDDNKQAFQFMQCCSQLLNQINVFLFLRKTFRAIRVVKWGLNYWQISMSSRN